MKTKVDGAVLGQLETLFNLGAIRELTDGQLLERFSTGPGELAELAFAALVERHGAMVRRVCRARLADPHDTQDAFQATFLVLVKQARALWVRESLGPWLHKVALRTASAARSASARRRKHEALAAERAAGTAGHDEEIGPELRRALHEEIGRLPERYRVPIVLCDLEGRTCEEAARHMGRPVGTVKSWRARGRERLRQRLLRSGVGPSVALGSVLAADGVRAAAPKPWTQEAARAAARLQSGRMIAGVAPASVDTLVKGVTKAMLLHKLRTAAMAVCALSVLAVGLAAAAREAAGDSKRPDAQPEAQPETGRPATSPEPRAVPEAADASVWRLSLHEAIGIGLGNSDGMRLVEQPGASPRSDDGYTVAADTGVEPQRFRAGVIERVRSIESLYWALVGRQAEQRGAEQALELAEEIKKREESKLKLGRGHVADLADVRRRLEGFSLDVVRKTSDVITAERRLREGLGLPRADNRRIVPVSAPTAEKVLSDWDACTATMLAKNPDVVRARATKAGPSDATRRGGPGHAESGKTSLDQVVHDSTHELAKFYLAADVEYTNYRSAREKRVSALEHLNAVRERYDEGNGPIERYLGAVGQYAESVANEARSKVRYNLALLGLRAIQGTLLEQERITVAGASAPDRSAVDMPEADAPPNATLREASSGPFEVRDSLSIAPR